MSPTQQRPAGTVSDAEVEAAAGSLCWGNPNRDHHGMPAWRLWEHEARAALQAAAQVREPSAAERERDEAIYTEADAARWNSEMDQRMADYCKLGDAYNAVVKDLAVAEVRADKAVEVLRSLEWSDVVATEESYTDGCPGCGALKENGHEPDCELAALIHPSADRVEAGGDAGEVRRQALEEAAKVAEAEPAYPSASAQEMQERVKGYRSRGFSWGQIGVALLQASSADTSRAIATRIRALATTNGGGDAG